MILLIFISNLLTYKAIENNTNSINMITVIICLHK